MGLHIRADALGSGLRAQLDAGRGRTGHWELKLCRISRVVRIAWVGLSSGKRGETNKGCFCILETGAHMSLPESDSRAGLG